MPKYSVVVPVYNRPQEVKELLDSLVNQTFKDFEVIIVEDGSTISCEEIVKEFKSLTTKYLFIKNCGQGFARNKGFELSQGEYIIIFDSDCLIPRNYFQIVDDYLSNNEIDAFGGPDASHESFNVIQKAISHVMTSFFTTGGIRGRKNHIGKFHPRSFNMGMHKNVYLKTKGYRIPFMGEDLELSVRIIKCGFKTALIEDAFVYHKRRTNLIKFFKQLRYFGRARINLSRFHANEVKIVHLFPALFLIGLIFSIALSVLSVFIGFIGLVIYSLYFLLIFIESLIVTRNIKVAILSPLAALLQLCGYGIGLISEWISMQLGINPNTKYIELY